VNRANGSGDWRRRADAVRDLPLQTILLERGAKQDPRDKSKWHTERGSLSFTESKFTNWCSHSGGGGAIDLVMHLANVDFRQAVVWLEQHFGTSQHQFRANHTLTNQQSTINTLRVTQSALSLPTADPSQLKRVLRYLTHQRCLPASSLNLLIASGKLYADPRGNAVFLLVGTKAQRPIGAELRGTGPQVWRGMAPGTDKNAGFFWVGDARSRTIVLCESAIDAISCYALFPEYLAISTSGARPTPRWLSGLLDRDYTIHCGYDTDEAGERAAAAMITAYPSVKRLQPPAHDWNEALVAQLSNIK
jgi:hypothetical protein